MVCDSFARIERFVQRFVCVGTAIRFSSNIRREICQWLLREEGTDGVDLGSWEFRPSVLAQFEWLRVWVLVFDQGIAVVVLAVRSVALA